jgi:hypothetical protein
MCRAAPTVPHTAGLHTKIGKPNLGAILPPTSRLASTRHTRKQSNMSSAVALLLLSASPTASLLLPTARTRLPQRAQRAASPCMMPRAPPEERLLFIDGNNLMAHRKVTKGRDELAAKLAGIRPAKVTIVFDGKRGEAESDSGSNPRVVVTRGGEEESGEDRETADEWIDRALCDVTADTMVEIVTADRELRRFAQMARVKTINPRKFWRRYLPRLKGLKNDYLNEPKADLSS